MATEMVDMAALDSQAAAVESNVDSGSEVETQVENQEVETSDAREGTEGNEDAEGEGSEAGKTQASDKADVGLALPKTVSQILKSINDSNPDDPNVKSATKQLRDAFFSDQAFRKEFGKLSDAKAFLSEIAGAQGPATLAQAREAYANTQGLIQNINETDEMVHSGNPQVWKNIVDDLKAENKLDALPKLAAGGLDTLKAHSREQFEDVFAPHFVEALESVNLPRALNAIFTALNQGNTTEAKTLLKGVGSWFSGLKGQVEDGKRANSEQAKIQTERQKWESEKAQSESKTFKETTATECDSYSNKALGKALQSYLKMPFFKDFPRETLIDLGNGIKERLYASLEADKTYRDQMKAQWGQKSPDKGKIVEFHRTKLDAIASEIVEKTIKQRYPSFAKGGSAAGRVAAAAQKKAADNKASVQSVAASKPIYVAAKPKDLVRSDVTVGGKKYTSSDLEMMLITGKGFVRNTSGTFKLVTWRR